MEIFFITLLLLITHISCFFSGRSTKWGEIREKFQEANELFKKATAKCEEHAAELHRFRMRGR